MSEYDPGPLFRALREEHELILFQKSCAKDGHQTSEESWITGSCSRCGAKITEKNPRGYR